MNVIIIAITLVIAKRPVAAHGEGHGVQHVVDWADHLIMLLMVMMMLMVTMIMIVLMLMLMMLKMMTMMVMTSSPL